MIVTQECSESGTTSDPNAANVLAVVLREHCKVFRTLDDGYSAKDVICELFGLTIKSVSG